MNTIFFKSSLRDWENLCRFERKFKMFDFSDLPLYCNSLTSYSRFETREVYVGKIPVGGNNPIRIQSMTNTNTLDTMATVEQAMRMFNAGSEFVRITTPTIAEAENLKQIKQELEKRGYRLPLIADVHFNPKVAELAATIVEKVRINPGNFSDKNIGKTSFTLEEHLAGVKKIKENITPLIEICKKHNTAMRIGVNHGSLSERIMCKYGDTPTGMVASALEFIAICNELEYHNIILSMKASNPVIMVQAYRLLASAMRKYGFNYPLHLGVTEAGEGMDGRIRSAIGIGALLEDGIGDTIRVSLTEAPENEIPVAKIIVNRYMDRMEHNEILSIEKLNYNPFQYSRRISLPVHNIGGNQVPIVMVDFTNKNIIRDEDIEAIGYIKINETWGKTDLAADYINFSNKIVPFNFPKEIGIITGSRTEQFEKNVFPVFKKDQYLKSSNRSEVLNFISMNAARLEEDFILELNKDHKVVILLKTENHHAMADLRRAFIQLNELKCTIPVVVQLNYWHEHFETFVLDSATDIGGLMVDGFADGVFLNLKSKMQNKGGDIINTAFSVLQATRTRITRTEYISCPTCGRTSYNMEATVREIKAKTSHLKGLKIAIMGCMVNGPGEMADADYGYVGAGQGKINLYYKGKIVKKNISEEESVNELVALLKEKGDWKESLNNN
ncbi:MAG: (E)-4-hydroxy-3-methylbut-2-enyl-diphosphate synthase [Bacteroidota bacterium]